jgi:hypothetical protein
MHDVNLEILFRQFVNRGDYQVANELAEKAMEHGYVIESYNKMMHEDQESEDQMVAEARGDFEDRNN